MLQRRVLTVLLVCLAIVATPHRFSARGRAGDLPSELSDHDFWKLSHDLSEPPGFFRSENLVSNETMFQWVIPDLTRTTKPGDVYLGVAPDQNFTYIVAMRPKMAFIVDIRRGNVLEHLMYKAIIEMSTDRADFLSHLFSRKRPASLTATSTADVLIRAYDAVQSDTALFDANQRAVLDTLEKKHGFTLSADDESQLKWIYTAFFTDGPELTYTSYGANVAGGRRVGGFARGGIGSYPGYGSLQIQTDARGVNHSYLANEDNFAFLKNFEAKNLIVPLTGDFAGPTALRAVGQYIRDHNASVSAFYTSNVEQYLFQQGDDWSRFYKNVASLPLSPGGVFIRSVPNSMVVPAQPGARAATMLCSLPDLVKAFTAGKIASYADVVVMSK